MKFPWDKDYLKICFYAVISFGLFYIIKIAVDVFHAVLMDMDKITGAAAMLISDTADVFSPLIIALIISYLLDPAVDFFQAKFHKLPVKFKRKMKIFKIKRNKQSSSVISGGKTRTAGTLLTYCAIILVVCVFSLKGLKPGALAGKISGVSGQLNDMLVLIYLKLEEWGLGENALAYFSGLSERIGKAILNNEGKILGAVTAVGKFLGNFFIALVVAFYLLRNKEYILNKSDETARILLKGKTYKRLLDICRDLNMVFSGYIRGQMTDAVIISILIGVGLKAIGIDFALVIGILTGFTNLVPFLGAITGFVLSVTMALVSGPPVKALYAAVYVIIIQQVDSIYIIPKIVGKKVSLSPAAVILAISVGGRLAGFLGMVLAVPVCSVARLWFGRYLEKQKNEKELSRIMGIYE